MRRRIITKTPILDREERVAVGVQIPFTSRSVFTSTFTTKEAVRINLINALLTGEQERYLNRGVGTPLRDQIFENITPGGLENLKNIIRSKIQQRFPRVEVRELVIENLEEENTVRVGLDYSIENTNIQDSINLEFE